MPNPVLLNEFESHTPNMELCKKMIMKNQKEYIRKRLRFIKYLWEGKTEIEAYTEVKICKATANKLLHTIVSLGVDEGLIEISKVKK